MTRALVAVGRANAVAEVDVYRDGPVVTVVARGGVVRATPHGQVRTNGTVMQQYDTVEAFEHDRDRVIKRFPLAYSKVADKLGFDDDARRAPPLPEAMRHLLPDHMRALSAAPSAASSSVTASVLALSAPSVHDLDEVG